MALDSNGISQPTYPPNPVGNAIGNYTIIVAEVLMFNVGINVILYVAYSPSVVG